MAIHEYLPAGQNIALGLQHVFAMFGATVLAPLLMGFDPSLTMLMTGISTILFFLITGGRVPSYHGSSFAFIGTVICDLLCACQCDGLWYTGGLCTDHQCGMGWITAVP